VKLWFRRTKSSAQKPPRPVSGRFKRLPGRPDPRSVRTSQQVRPARDPEGGRDTDRDFITRYGDPFDE
jgi:hypothetical protein